MVAIWKTLLPSSGSLTFWIFASRVAERAERVAHLVDARRRSSGVVIRVPDSKSMPKLIPRPAIAIAPAARITPDIEKNQCDLPMKSKRQRLPAARLDAERAADAAARGVRAIEPRIAEVASTAVNSDTQRADAEREGEALDAGGGEHEQDERHADRHDVGVDDRPQRLRVAGGDGRAGSICPPRTSSLIRSNMTMFASAATAKREHHAGDARQRERDRDQLDEREQEHAVDDQRAPRPPGRARGRRGSGRHREQRGRRRPASRPWWSACLPSVAETCVFEISLSSIGSAPMRRFSARSWVS